MERLALSRASKPSRKVYQGGDETLVEARVLSTFPSSLGSFRFSLLTSWYRFFCSRVSSLSTEPLWTAEPNNKPARTAQCLHQSFLKTLPHPGIVLHAFWRKQHKPSRPFNNVQQELLSLLRLLADAFPLQGRAAQSWSRWSAGVHQRMASETMFLSMDA